MIRHHEPTSDPRSARRRVLPAPHPGSRRRLEQPPRPLQAETVRPVHLRVLTELEAALSAGSGYVYRLLSALETLATLLGAEEAAAEAITSAAEDASVHSRRVLPPDGGAAEGGAGALSSFT